MTRTTLWLRDLALVINELQPESFELAVQMAALLPIDIAPPPDAVDAASPAIQQRRRRGARDEDEPTPLPKPLATSPTSSRDERRATPIVLQRLPDRQTRRDDLAGHFVEPIGEDGPRVAPPFAPLLRPDWTRGILHAALATPVATREVDVERLVQRAAALQPIERLPLRRRERLQQGVQVLVDAGDGMALFARDAQDVVRQAMAVAGRSTTQVLRFVGTPLRECRPRTGLRAIDYAPPPAGTPVLVLTDLGIGRAMGPTDDDAPPPAGTPVLVLTDLGIGRGAGTSSDDAPPAASVADWRAFAAIASDAGCPVTALVPYPASRVPRALREAVRVLHWDGRTSVRDVVRGRAAARAR